MKEPIKEARKNILASLRASQKLALDAARRHTLRAAAVGPMAPMNHGGIAEHYAERARLLGLAIDAIEGEGRPAEGITLSELERLLTRAV